MSTSRKQLADRTWPWVAVVVAAVEVADVVVGAAAVVVASSRMETSGEVRVKLGVKVVELGEVIRELLPEVGVITPTKLEAPPTGAVEQVDTVEPKEVNKTFFLRFKKSPIPSICS